MEEVWRTVVIDGEVYDNYMVSSWGNVKSLNYHRTGEEKILSPGKVRGNYLRVILSKEGKIKRCLVHRLVAETFLENTNNFPCVDHINTIRTDNRVENLRFCTRKENSNNELSRKHNSKSHKGIAVPRYSKAVICLETGHVFSSTNAVERELGIAHGSISNCCVGRYKTAGGFHWEYLE